MCNHYHARCATLACCFALFATTCFSQEPRLREIFVPFDDLHVILENDNQRVFLSRKDYEELIAKAVSKADVHAPQATAILAASYEGNLEDGRATIEGKLQIEVLNSGLQAIPLDVANVGIRTALLDGKPATLGRNAQGQVILFVEGQGKHELTLSLTALLQTSAATQTLQLTLPTTAAARRLQLTVAGNVEVKAGASVIRRVYDQDSNVTRLELLPSRASLAVVMSLNNKTLQDQRVVVANSVLVTEVTQGYERIHARVSHRILHGAVDKFRFSVPAGFEVTKVETPLLARWEMKQEMIAGAPTNVLEALLREPSRENVVLEISATRSPPVFDDWSLPRLVPLDVIGQVAVVGLLVDDRLQAEQIAPSGLLPLDAAVLTAAIPESVNKAEPGAPKRVRQVVTYYAPGPDYSLTASITKPPAEMIVTSSALLAVSDREARVSGQFILAPQAEDLFDVRLLAPSGWQVTSVLDFNGTPLALERYEGNDGTASYLVRLPGGVAAGQQRAIRFLAVSTPPGWLENWTTQKLDFPQFTLAGTTRETGAIGIAVEDDLTARPVELQGLTPLSDEERKPLVASGQNVALAYRFDARPFAAPLVIERTASSLAAEIFAFFKLDTDSLQAFYEIHYDVRDARARQLVFSLPEGTPKEITISGIAPTVVKETTARVADGRRQWVVQLAERQRGNVRLTVRFTQRYAQPEPKDLLLPLLRAEDVEHQSALVGVEGSAELDIQATSHPRDVDVGELYGATQYSISQRLVGAYGYVGTDASIQVDVFRRPQYALPAALVQRAELVTRVSPNGIVQSVVRYDLKTKATLLEIRLPPAAKLWSVILDGAPMKPQREIAPGAGDRLLLTLPAQTAAALRKLQIVYEMPSTRFTSQGAVEAEAPQLLTQGIEIPQANLVWTLVLPTGYQLQRASGTVFTQAEPVRDVALVRTMKWLVEALQTPWGRRWRMAAGAYDRTAKMSTKSAKREAFNEESIQRRSGYLDVDRSESAAESMPLPDALDLPVPPTAEPPPAEAPSPAIPEPTVTASPKPAKMPMPDEGGEGQPGDAAPGLDLKPKVDTHWAEQGLSSLQIDVANDTGSSAVTFHSLGEAPILRAQLVNRARLKWVGLGVGGLVLLIGVGLTNQPLRQRVVFVVLMLLLGTVPLLLTTRLAPLAPIFDACFFGALVLIPYFLVAAAGRTIWHWVAPRVLRFVVPPVPQAALPVLALLLGLVVSPVLAQVPIEVKNLKDLLPLMDPGGPVAIPRDAIILPYDSEKEDGLKNAEKVLVPYEKYVELWNRANPDKKLTTVPLPAMYALAGASYAATLSDAETLTVEGTIEIELFSDKPVTIPLTLVGGVLSKATVDDQPARIQVVVPGPDAQAKAVPAEAVALLHVSGKGRKKFALTINMALERRGGWRVVTGRLPAAPATALTLTVPAEQIEVRLADLPDKGVFESTKPNDVLETALGADGALGLQWRLKVAEGMVDQSLTARSAAVVDVREDTVRMTWRVQLDFGRGSRESFKLTVPSGYLVEQVTGENIRGWQVKGENERQTVDVTLLKAATSSETITLQLAKRGLVGQGDLASFAVPDVRVEAVALHQGEIAIRRSRRLDVRGITVAGLSRADADGQTAAVEQIADATDAAGIELTPFQSYRFVREGFQLVLAAGQLSHQTTAQLRMIVRAEERGDSLDALVTFQVQGEPLYRARMYLPAGLEIDQLVAVDAAGAAATIDWAVSTEEAGAEKRKLLTVYLPAGQQQRFTLQLLGRLGKRAKASELPASRFEVLDVQRQEGEIVVAPDRDTDVEATKLANLERIPGMEVIGWLNERQRPLAKLALRFRTSDYAAVLVFTPRTPQITANTLTNVKITPKEIQETLFFRFHVADAGVRELVVLVPKAFAKARLPDALLQSGRVLQKIVEPATGADGKPLANVVRMRFVLPEYVDGQIDLGLTRDRLLTDTEQPVAIPDIATGRLQQRLIVLENTSRDEVVTDASPGLETVSPGQQAWNELKGFLGADSVFTQAFAVSPNAAAPKLTFKTQIRQRAVQSQATIGLAEHLLIVDAFGAYRGRVELKVANETEQFMEIELPADARLWTAIVAGQPVKPVEPSGKQTRVVRIPLIKTAQGEGDYAVVLKYGGRIERVRDLTQVNFPLIKVVGPNNLSVEQSHVRLYLPKSFHWNWMEFGGTLKQVSSHGTLVDEINAYYNKQILACQNMLSSADDFTKIRITSNLQKIEQELAQQRDSFESSGSQLNLQNEKLLAAVQLEAAAQQQEFLFESEDNRSRLNSLWSKQKQERTKNNATQLGSNFDLPQQGVAPAATKTQTFNREWFAQNALDAKKGGGFGVGDISAGGAKPGSRVAVGKLNKFDDNSISGGFLQNQGEAKGQGQGGGQGAQLELNDYGRQGDSSKPGEGLELGNGRGMGKDNLRRYGQQLNEQNKQQAGELAPTTATPEDRAGGGRYVAPELPRGPVAAGIDPLDAVIPVAPLQPSLGLSSLDIELPIDTTNYDEFLFSTPRGDLRITARPVSTTLATQLAGWAWVAALTLLIWLLTRRPLQQTIGQFAHYLPVGISLITLGVLLLVILPLAGLLLGMLGIWQIGYWIYLRQNRRTVH